MLSAFQGLPSHLFFHHLILRLRLLSQDAKQQKKRQARHEFKDEKVAASTWLSSCFTYFALYYIIALLRNVLI